MGGRTVPISEAAFCSSSYQSAGLEFIGYDYELSMKALHCEVFWSLAISMLTPGVLQTICLRRANPMGICGAHRGQRTDPRRKSSPESHLRPVLSRTATPARREPRSASGDQCTDCTVYSRTDLSHASADHIGAAFDKSQNYSSCTSKVAAAPVFSQLDGAFAHRPRLQTSRHPLGMGRHSGFPLNRQGSSVSSGSGGCGCEIAKVLDDG